jgi:acetyl-CoA synthetase
VGEAAGVSQLDAHVRALCDEYADPAASAAWLLCDRYPADKVALTIVEEDRSAHDLSYGELRDLSERCASALAELGVGPGDRVASLMGKGPELVAVMLGAWRLGAVYVPLFTAFGPQAIAMRLLDTQTKVVIADPDQRPKLDPGPDMPADGGWRIVVSGEGPAAGEDLALGALLAREPREIAPYAGGGEWPLVHMLTSGTTGRPKGVVHPLAYLADWHAYLEYGLGVRAGDAFWCAADPGWAYGLYGAIVTPLAMGLPSHLVCGGFDAERTLRVLAERRITNFAAAPTVYRALRTCETVPTDDIRLRCASSAGEPLTPEVNEWARDALGTVVHDHYGQTELGMCVGNHQHPDVARPIKPGSMGQALPGWSVLVLRDDADEPAPTDTLGRLVIDVPASPLMTFRGYEPGDASSKFSGDGRWYVTGDAARQDEDGDVFFSARDDDVIIMAGYRIGPFDVESVLAQHEAVAECAVIAVPDEVRGEVIEAIVVPRAPHAPSDELARELQQLVKERYAAHAYPRRVSFTEALPKTESGKIQRVVLRKRRVAELQTAGTEAS